MAQSHRRERHLFLQYNIRSIEPNFYVQALRVSTLHSYTIHIWYQNKAQKLIYLDHLPASPEEGKKKGCNFKETKEKPKKDRFYGYLVHGTI